MLREPRLFQAGGRAGMGCGQNRVEAVGGLFGDVVDDDGVVFPPGGEFLGGVAEAFPDGFLRFRAAAAEALFESRK